MTEANGRDVVIERVDIRGQAENYFFWPSKAWAELGGSLALQVLDRSSLTIVQTYSHPCAEMKSILAESVLQVHDSTVYLELARSTISYIYVKGQAHNCCVDNRCLTLQPRAQSMGPTASGRYGASPTALLTRPSCSTLKDAISGTGLLTPAHVTPTSSLSRHTTDVPSRMPTASAVAVPSSSGSNANGGHGHVSPAVDNAASGVQETGYWSALTLTLLPLLLL